MNIVVLEKASVGTDIDITCYENLGTVTYYDNTVTVKEAAQRIQNAEIVIANKAPLRREALETAEHLKLICVLATGYDNVDTGFCKDHGIKVANVVNYSTPMVAQHTITLALALSQKIVAYDTYVKSGAYSAQSGFSYFGFPFAELEGKTWGIVGMGNIGKRVAKIAEAFGCRVIYHSLTGKSSCTEYEQVDKDTLLAMSDYLSLHCPLSGLSENFIDAEALRKMKNTAVLVNVARGPVVNNTDLYHALMENEIAAAGLDVLEEEPLRESNPLSRIKDSSRLIITPHLAWASVEARTRCVMGVYQNIEAFLRGEERNVVNL